MDLIAEINSNLDRLSRTFCLYDSSAYDVLKRHLGIALGNHSTSRDYIMMELGLEALAHEKEEWCRAAIQLGSEIPRVKLEILDGGYVNVHLDYSEEENSEKSESPIQDEIYTPLVTANPLPFPLDTSYFTMLETLSTKGFQHVDKDSRNIVRISGPFTGEKLDKVLQRLRKRKLEPARVYLANNVFKDFRRSYHKDFEVEILAANLKNGLMGNFGGDLDVYSRREVPNGTVYITGFVPQEKESFDMLGTDSFNIGGVVKVQVVPEDKVELEVNE